MIVDSVLSSDWFVVARSEEVSQGKLVPARLLDEDIVLWRCEGEPKAFQDLCIHRGARLSLGWIDNNQLTCAYHGFTYDGQGRCVRIPAHPEQKPPLKATVRTYWAKDKYGMVWVSLGNGHALPPFPEWDNPSFRKIFLGSFDIHASAPRFIENALDIAHFPFVHMGILGDPKHAEVADYDVKVDSGGIVAPNVPFWQPDPDGTGQGRVAKYTFRLFGPFHLVLTKEPEEPGGHTLILWASVTPIEEKECRLWFWAAMNYAQELTDEDVRAFHSRIVKQDFPIVESQRPELLPLDLQAELHLRFDKIAIAYRKWLKQLGVKFGTA